MQKVYSAAELIREFGGKVSSRPCSNCNQWTLYRVADFLLCSLCDVALEDKSR